MKYIIECEERTKNNFAAFLNLVQLSGSPKELAGALDELGKCIAAMSTASEYKEPTPCPKKKNELKP